MTIISKEEIIPFVVIFLLFASFISLSIYFFLKKDDNLGQNKCTEGPAYWCASKDNFDQCNTDKKQTYEKHCLRSQNKCSEGPAYWCASKDNFDQCNTDKEQTYEKHCQPDQNKCTEGPAYWCASKDNFDQCNADTSQTYEKHCFKQCYGKFTNGDKKICVNMGKHKDCGAHGGFDTCPTGYIKTNNPNTSREKNDYCYENNLKSENEDMDSKPYCIADITNIEHGCNPLYRYDQCDMDRTIIPYPN
jgi:hypothetical protein